MRRGHWAAGRPIASSHGGVTGWVNARGLFDRKRENRRRNEAFAHAQPRFAGLAAYFFDSRQTMPAPSSLIRIDPSFSSVTPAGRPQTLRSSTTQPVTRSS